jgi:hypothetical protein
MTAAALPSTVLDRYRLDEVLRRAAATTTYAGVDQTTGQPVVVKELRVGGMEGWKEFDLFEREIATLGALDHPGLPRLLDHRRLEEPGDVRVLLVMTRMPGTPLDRRIAEGHPLDAALGRKVLDGLLDILAFLHGQMPAVVHRDIKPSNLILDGERVYLVDFGGVRRYLPWAKDGSTMVGTFGYLAPEQLHGEATPASDLYSLGATLAALLEARDAQDLPHQGLRVDLDRLERIPAGLRDVLAGLLEPDPAQRLSAVHQVRQALATGDRGASGSGGGGAGAGAGELTLRWPGYWLLRRVAQIGLGAVAAGLFLTALLMEFLQSLFHAPLFGDLAMGFSMASVASVLSALLVRTRRRYERKLLKLARKQQGRLHLADAVERIGLPAERARELLDDLVTRGLARRDPRDASEYLVGSDRGPGRQS